MKKDDIVNKHKKYLLLMKYTQEGVGWTIFEEKDTLEEIEDEFKIRAAFFVNEFLIVENKLWTDTESKT